MQFADLPLKLEDCARPGPGSGAELFVVEGDSAAGAVIRLRDRACQAVLPMQGKPLNAIKAGPARVRGYPLFAAFGAALGTELGARLDLATLRYDRVLLLFDPDADGIHCGALFLMFLYRWMPALLESGRVFLVRAPVARVEFGAGRGTELPLSEPQLHAVIARERAAQNPLLRVKHFRGLAGIPGEVLTAYCIEPTTRRAAPVGMADAEMAMAVFSTDALGDDDRAGDAPS